MGLAFVVAVFLQGVQDIGHLVQCKVVIQLHIQAKAALGQIQGFHSFRKVVEDLAAGGKGEKLAVHIQVDGNDLIPAADLNQILNTIGTVLGVDDIYAALYKVRHDLMDAAVGVHIDHNVRPGGFDHAVKLAEAGL